MFVINGLYYVEVGSLNAHCLESFYHKWVMKFVKRRHSRWWKSKTWRSPSSPQIHQKYIYMWNTPTEHLLNASRRPQTSQKARNSPRTWVGLKKKGKTETKEYGRDLHLWEGAVKEEKFPKTRKPLHWRRQGVGAAEASEPWRRAQQQGCRGQSGEIPAQRIGAHQHSTA